jgi:hypothetical protein
MRHAAVRERGTAVRRCLAVGLAVVSGSTVVWWWLVAGSFAEQIG